MDPLRCIKMTAYLSSRKHSTLLLPRDPVLKLSMKRTCATAREGVRTISAAARERGGASARRRRGAHRVLLERHGRASARHQHDAPARPPGPQMPLHKRLDLVADPGARRGHLYVARACEHPASSRVPAGGAKAQGAQTTGRVVCARVCARTHVCVCARVRANARTHAPGACAVRSALARGLAQGCVRARGGHPSASACDSAGPSASVASGAAAHRSRTPTLAGAQRCSDWREHPHKAMLCLSVCICVRPAR